MVRMVSSSLGQIVTRGAELSISAERKNTTTVSAAVVTEQLGGAIRA